MNSLLEQSLQSQATLIVEQRHEIAELIGIETRNKYEIHTEDGTNVGFAAEQQKGIFGFLMRQFLGHWRTFDLLFFDSRQQLVCRAAHPFCFIFQRIEVFAPDGKRIGALQQRFAIFSKKFDVEDAGRNVHLTMTSPLWRIWTFTFFSRGREVATVEKKWSGILSEAFTDKDRFRVSIGDPEMHHRLRLLILVSAVFIDLIYFEHKAKSGFKFRSSN
jgi:hypothetical protein